MAKMTKENWVPMALTHEGLRQVSDFTPFGKKALGLSKIPTPWTLPYILITSELLKSCSITNDQLRKKNLKSWLRKTENAVFSIWNKESILILRSSGQKENIDARGRYSSKVFNANELELTLKRYVEEFQQDEHISKDDVSLIIQEYRKPKFYGHLSNERRCYKEVRDWLGESSRHGGNCADPFQINLRNWRDGRKVGELHTSPLLCTMELNISDVLRIPASWVTQRSERIHFEWVWDGDFIWLVQGDADDTVSGEDPTRIAPKAKISTLSKFEVLRPICPQSHRKYPKIENALIYRELNLPSSELFILDDQNIIKKISEEYIPDDLSRDIANLAKNPVIVRCDITSTDKSQRQMLPRTDEQRVTEEIIAWLKKTALSLLSQGFGDVEPAFIFHNFIPAQASAFVYAEPGNREVLIEALWGLPEGLYYNSHDKYVVDTGSSDLDMVIAAGEAIVKFDVYEAYKPFFISPNAKGNWVAHKLKIPFDWKSSIQPTELIPDIAICARKICERVGKPVSVMWFVGLDSDDISIAHMPWHHEEASVSELRSLETNVRQKKPFEKDFIIRTEEDLKRIESVQPGSISRVKVQPQEDRLLRDKDLLKAVGELSKKHGIPIVLEGGVLSHAYYQLTATGAVVQIFHPFIVKRTTQEFNKLVRDKIPITIRRFGENVRVAKVSGDVKLLALKDKLIEEAFEVADSIGDSHLIEELCDVQEIILEILSHHNLTYESLEEVRLAKLAKKGGFNLGLILLDTTLSQDDSFQDQMSLFKVEETSSYYHLNEDHYLNLVKSVSSRVDQRISDQKRESLRQASMPIVSTSWEGSTRPIITRLNGDEVVGKVVISREGERLRVDLRVEITNKEGEFLSLY